MFNFSKQEKVLILILILFILGGWGIYFTLNKPAVLKEKDILEKKENISNSQRTEEIVIQVAGAVKNPGVYKFKKGTRVFEAINVAGGYSIQADIEKVNLVKVLEDGEKIFVPFKNTSSSSSGSNLININIASEEELCKLPGIGPALAKRIIEYRENKQFSSIEEIKNVKGIGEKKFEKIKNLITLN